MLFVGRPLYVLEAYMTCGWSAKSLLKIHIRGFWAGREACIPRLESQRVSGR